jgi:DNA adenine methylase
LQVRSHRLITKRSLPLAYSNDLMAKPFVKWAGGKRQLMDQILSKVPPSFGEGEFRRYVEPFVGGGAALFKFLELGSIDEALIIDVNSDLILTYEVIKEDVELLIEKLTQLQNTYDAINGYVKRKNEYNGIRKKFRLVQNKEKDILSPDERAIHASRFIYLNKVGFNGLFRVNSKGEFNVPPSDLKEKTIFNDDKLRDVSTALEKVEIRHGDFSVCEDWIDENTFVYFDPPYRPVTKTSFTAYSNSNFDESQQINLADFCTDLHNKGAKVMVSNSDPTQNNPEDKFFEENFSEPTFKHHPVYALRSINSDGAGRGKVSELIITNY